jgi:hypothetical protein
MSCEERRQPFTNRVYSDTSISAQPQFKLLGEGITRMYVSVSEVTSDSHSFHTLIFEQCAETKVRSLAHGLVLHDQCS